MDWFLIKYLALIALALLTWETLEWIDRRRRRGKNQ